MDKRGIFLFITTMLFLWGCQSSVPMETTPLPEASLPEIVEERIPEETTYLPENSESSAGTIPEHDKTRDEYSLVYPTLTYAGAYNGPLYATSEQIGSASMDPYFKNLDRNGISFFIGFFSISGAPQQSTLLSDQGLGKVIDTVKRHPRRIIPFFNPGIGGEEIENKQYLQGSWFNWYETTLVASQKIVGMDFIRGFGEIETQEWSVKHTDVRILQLIDLARKNNLHFMFHPVPSKLPDVKKIVESYPNTIFLIHMYREDVTQSRTELITLLQEHENLYFSMDAAHILHVDGDDIIYSYDSKNSQSSIDRFVAVFDQQEKTIVAGAIRDYKPLVDAVPDKIMWGTEIGPQYAFDAEVFDRAVKVSRLVIAGFDQEDQEAVGYKNALRVFGLGVVIDKDIPVLNTRSWPECTDAQIHACDESCDTPDTDVPLTGESEQCYLNCVISASCREVPVMDIG